MKLVQVQPNYIHQHWDKVSPFIQDSIVKSNSDFTLEQARLLLVQGTWILIVVMNGNVVNGCLCITFINNPNARLAVITAIGGYLIVANDTWNQLKEMLRKFGATSIQGAARPSIARLWRRLGFIEKHVIVEKEL